jgi:hypothetical protein
MSIRLVKGGLGSTTMQRDKALNELRGLLRDLFRMRHEGVAYAKLAHAQGLVDGYMRTLTDLGIVEDAALLQVIAEARRGVDGPATGPTLFERSVESVSEEAAIPLNTRRALA